MLALSGGGIETRGLAAGHRLIVRIRSGTSAAPLTESDYVLVRGPEDLGRSRNALALRGAAGLLQGASGADRAIILPDQFGYLGDGDIIALDPGRSRARVLYRRMANANSFLLTERCNHYCLMCSQPPKDINDDWIVDELVDAIPLVDPATHEIGLTGGEPTLLGDRLILLLNLLRDHLPQTAVHLLSNGRRFVDPSFAELYASVRHHDLMIGIPIYSDVAHIHDYVVQADGAFDETIRGILNLKAAGQRVEIRVVIHKQNYERLPQLAAFLARNLTFVDHVALMGLEVTGFAKANLETLWIDPFDYRDELREAASILSDMRMRVSVYNHQLCTLHRQTWQLAVRSISDWKNEYRPECETCAVQSRCGGFFSTGTLRQSAHIAPVASDDGSP